MTDLLETILERQKVLQKKFGVTFPIEDKTERANYIKEQSFWTINEIGEMIHEIPFVKDWKEYNYSEEAYEEKIQLAREEWIDTLIFLSNIGNALGFDKELISKMYNEKNKINHDRQDNGYEETDK